MKLKSPVRRRWDLVLPHVVCSANATAPRRLSVGCSLGVDAKQFVTIKPGLHSRPYELRRA